MVLCIEGDVSEGEGRDLTAHSRDRVGAGGEEVAPKVCHVAGYEHAVDRRGYLAVLEEEAGNAVGEVAGGAVAVAAVEVRDQDAASAEVQNILLGLSLIHI